MTNSHKLMTSLLPLIAKLLSKLVVVGSWLVYI